MKSNARYAIALVLVGTLPGEAGSHEPITALDLQGVWVETPWATPVIDRGDAGAWDHYAVDNPYLYFENGVYYCFYEGQDQPFRGEQGHERTGLATSKDGISWTKHERNPMLDVGGSTTWNHMSAKLPAGVLKRDGLYYLFYSGRTGDTKQVGVATARSLGGPWLKRDQPILSGRADKWDRQLSTLPTPIFQVDGKFCLLYRGMQKFYEQQGIGLAVSRDLISWERIPTAEDAPLVSVTEEIASLAVTETPRGYVGISQPKDLKRRRYWLSQDLVQWRSGPAVRIKASVQIETASNPILIAGEWCILYEQQDRIYRAVLVSDNDD